ANGGRLRRPAQAALADQTLRRQREALQQVLAPAPGLALRPRLGGGRQERYLQRDQQRGEQQAGHGGSFGPAAPLVKTAKPYLDGYVIESGNSFVRRPGSRAGRLPLVGGAAALDFANTASGRGG